VTVAATMLASCGGGSVTDAIDPATAPIAGIYDLTSTNGASLPATFVSNGTVVTIRSDVFVLGEGGSWTETYTATETRAGVTTPVTTVRSGTYARSVTSVTFRNSANDTAYSGTFTGRGLLVTDSGGRSYSFVRR
jgi:hypothetical protein